MQRQELVTIELTILMCENLAIGDRNGFSDPYIEIHIANNKKFKTRTIKKTLNPIYNETFILENVSESDLIEFKAMDWDLIGKDDYLGTAYLKYSEDEFPHNTIVDLSLPFSSKGTIYLKAIALQDEAKINAKLLDGLPGLQYEHFVHPRDSDKCFQLVMSKKMELIELFGNITDNGVQKLVFSPKNTDEPIFFEIRKFYNLEGLDLTEILALAIKPEIDKLANYCKLSRKVLHNGESSETCYGKFKKTAIYHHDCFSFDSHRTVRFNTYALVGQKDVHSPFVECYMWSTTSFFGSCIEPQMIGMLKRVAGYSKIR